MTTRNPQRITKKEFIRKGFSLGTEFALTVIVFLFLGFYLGGFLGQLGKVVLMLIGATLGFVIGLHRLVKKATALKG